MRGLAAISSFILGIGLVCLAAATGGPWWIGIFAGILMGPTVVYIIMTGSK